MTLAGSEPYRISCPARVLDKVRGWFRDTASVDSDQARKLLESLKEVNQHLTHDPLAWGDPQYNTRGIPMVIYRGICHLLIATYAVHEERRLVLVIDIDRMPGQPAGSDSN